MLVAAKIRKLLNKSYSKYKVATVNAATYLQQLNLQQLNKTKKPSKDEDVKEFYIKLKEESLKGPVFSEQVIKKVEDLTLDLNKNEIKWLANILKSSNPKLSDLPSIIEWVRATNVVLNSQSFNDVLSKAKEWHEDSKAPKESFGKFKTKDVVFRLPGGYTIVKVTDCDDIVLEGEIVQNCLKDPKWNWCEKVTNGETTIFSLRDSGNRPNVSIEVLPDGEVAQIRGKQNAKPFLEYQKMLLPWLATFKDNSWLIILKNDDWEILVDPEFGSIIAPYIRKYKNLQLAYDIAFYLSQYVDDPNISEMQKIVEESNDEDLVYDFARNVIGAYIPSLQKIIEESENLNLILYFAETVPGADIPSLQKKIIESDNANLAYYFARKIRNADIPALQEVVEKNFTTKDLLLKFANIPGSDIESLKKVYERNSKDKWPDSGKKEGKAIRKELQARILNVAKSLNSIVR